MMPPVGELILPSSPEHAAAWCGWLLVPLRRLAMAGETPPRLRCLALSGALINTLMTTGDDRQKALGVLLDWWRQAALEQGVGWSWQLEDYLQDPRLASPLKGLIEGDTLTDRLAPLRFQEALELLDELAHRQHKLMKSPGPALVRDAQQQALRLLKAAELRAPAPDLELLSRDPEDWASTTINTEQLVHGSPVWNNVHKHLAELQSAAQRVRALWTRASITPAELPGDWRDLLRDALGPEYLEIGEGLLHDALRLDEPGRQLPAALDPGGWLAGLPAAAPTALTELRALVDVTAELSEAAGRPAPEWCRAALGRLEALREDLERLRAIAGKVQHPELPAILDEALQELEAGKASEAAVAAELASGELDRLEEAARTEQLNREQELSALRRRAAELANSLPAHLRRSPEVAGALEEAGRGPPERARAALARARELAGVALEALEAALREVDRPLWRRGCAAALSPTALEDLHRLLRRLAAREALGMPFESERARAGAVIAAAEEGRLEALGRWVLRGPAGQVTICWPGAISEGPADAPPPGSSLALVQGGLALETPAGLLQAPGPPLWPGATRGYLQRDGEVVGPYRRAGGSWAPDDRMARIPARDFLRLFGTAALPGGGALVEDAPDQDALLAAGGVAWEVLDDRELAGWLSEALSAEAIEGLKALAERTDALPERLVRERFIGLGRLLGFAPQLEAARRDAVAAWLGSPAARQTLEQATQAAIAEAIRRQSAPIDAALDARERQLAAASEQLTGLQEAVSARKEEIEALEALASDRKTALLAELLGRAAPPAPGAPGSDRQPEPGGVRSATPEEPISARPGPRSAPEDLLAFAEAAAERAPGRSREEVFNLLLTALTNPWTLLAGPPGCGKSTLARDLFTLLGHGPESERLLELVVRHDWQDDAPLFGFWHPGESRWAPSSEGLVERLLEAADDWERGLGGLYAVLVEELNLAAPEYYLARLISALESHRPEVRLYSEALRPRNRARYPAAVRLAPNVRVLGTVNIDETVQRLSPRFLSRASVIWVEPDLDQLLSAPPPRPQPPPDPPRWGALLALVQARGRAPLPEAVAQVVRFLHHHSVPGATTPRALEGMRRYLAAAQGLLSATDAEDLQILQRVLPGLRGVGPRYRRLLEELEGMLSERGWRRSAARCARARARGEEQGDYYDLFHVA
jgi:energy-coupling factor transporter ATP-binding protein EcfA2